MPLKTFKHDNEVNPTEAVNYLMVDAGVRHLHELELH